MRRYTIGNTVFINEGTTKYVNFYIFTPSGAAEDLTGFKAKVYIEKLAGSKINIAKECDIKDNCVTFKLSPKDTKGVKQARFEVRLIYEGNVYSLAGMIVVKKSLIKFTDDTTNYFPDYTNPSLDIDVDGGELQQGEIPISPDVPPDTPAEDVKPPEIDVDVDGGDLDTVEDVQVDLFLDGGDL